MPPRRYVISAYNSPPLNRSSCVSRRSGRHILLRICSRQIKTSSKTSILSSTFVRLISMNWNTYWSNQERNQIQASIDLAKSSRRFSPSGKSKRLLRGSRNGNLQCLFCYKSLAGSSRPLHNNLSRTTGNQFLTTFTTYTVAMSSKPRINSMPSRMGKKLSTKP